MVLPVLQGLETIHHGAVISIGSGSHDHENESEVSPSQTWVLVPGNCRKVATRKGEGGNADHDGWRVCSECGGKVSEGVRTEEEEG